MSVTQADTTTTIASGPVSGPVTQPRPARRTGRPVTFQTAPQSVSKCGSQTARTPVPVTRSLLLQTPAAAGRFHQCQLVWKMSRRATSTVPAAVPHPRHPVMPGSVQVVVPASRAGVPAQPPSAVTAVSSPA